jgi:hypothetical protein
LKAVASELQFHPQWTTHHAQSSVNLLPQARVNFRVVKPGQHSPIMIV